MRLHIYGWILVTGCLSASHAHAQQVRGAINDPLADAIGCAEALAILAAAPNVSAQQQAYADALCESEAAQPRPDPDTAAALQQWQRANVAAIARHVRGLMASRNPRDQLAIAMLAHPAGLSHLVEATHWTTDEATSAYAAARRLGPDDRLLAWLEAVDCPRALAGSACDPQAALARLQRLEPDNAAVWIMALDRPVAQGDEAAVDRLLARAAAGSRYAMPFGEIALLLFQTLQKVDAPSMTPRVAVALGADLGLGRPARADDMAAIQAMAIASAVALPAYQPLQKVCVGRDSKPVRAQRLPVCIAIYALLAQDGLLVSQNIALINLVRLTAVDAVAGPQWRERLRQMLWVRVQAMKHLTTGVAEGYLQSVWRNGELPALEAVLSGAGVPVAAPPGWLPDDARHRALIGTGRDPVER